MTYEEAIRYAIGLTKSGGNMQRQEFGKLAVKALEKQIPKKHFVMINKVNQRELNCPNCDAFHGYYGDVYIPSNSEFCPWCGQAIDWSDE